MFAETVVSCTIAEEVDGVTVVLFTVAIVSLTTALLSTPEMLVSMIKLHESSIEPSGLSFKTQR
ncbi:MAG TPA: hypothetical protein ACFYD3_02885, partial [Candidatus Hypogeohydataceae bacterium YC41]